MYGPPHSQAFSRVSSRDHIAWGPVKIAYVARSLRVARDLAFEFRPGNPRSRSCVCQRCHNEHAPHRDELPHWDAQGTPVN